VYRDVHALIGFGFVVKDDKGRLLVPFSRIRAEFDIVGTQAA
jgi:hypothetical protein